MICFSAYVNIYVQIQSLYKTTVPYKQVALLSRMKVTSPVWISSKSQNVQFCCDKMAGHTAAQDVHDCSQPSQITKTLMA
jgi:hypothetical protein